jgi:DNA-damage-inducible protein J
MNSSATVQVRVDEQTKAQAKKVLDALHLSMSEAICLFLRQVVLHRGIPFEVKLPNALTRRTMEESERGEDLHESATVEELFEDLNT